MTHVEIHWCETATDAARLQYAGLPRLDIEPSKCGACNTQVAEIEGRNGTVSWRPCGLVLNGETIAVICARCFNGVDKALRNR